MTRYFLIEPFEPLTIRGNRSFGAPGEHGESQMMPPWPSVFAGAIRAAILGRDAATLAAFKPDVSVPLSGPIGCVLGTVDAPGSFRLSWLSLAHHSEDKWVPAIPAPADLVIGEDNVIHQFAPQVLPAGVSAGFPLPLAPVLRVARQAKPQAGCWIAGEHLERYLSGETPGETLKASVFFKKETRVGIALDHATRTASEGHIYSTEAVSFHKCAGFLVGVDGAEECILPDEGLLRLGGDGTATRYTALPSFSLPTFSADEAIRASGRFRLVLTSPAIFEHGWIPDRTLDSSSGLRLMLDGFSARLASAAFGAHSVISGWDIARWQPKAARRVVPAGSVYWFDQAEGDPRKLAEWVSGGIWPDNPDKQRMAEGFNQAALAAWSRTA